MPYSLIHPEHIWLIWAIILSVTTLSLHLEKRYKWAQKLSAAVIGLLLAALLTNLHILPLESSVYDSI